MATSSGSNTHHQSASKMLPPCPQPRRGGLQVSPSLVFSHPHLSPAAQKPRSNSHHMPTLPAADAAMAKKMEKGKSVINFPEQSVIRRVSTISLLDIGRERVEIISEKMHGLPDEVLQKLKNGLSVVLEGNAGSRFVEKFLKLQKFVQSRSDLTATTLITAHRVQLEILVAISTGIQAFLHPNTCLSRTSLIDVFTYKRCKNLSCQNQLPACGCTCGICTYRSGFCNLCMCLVCNQFDFEVNTCRWVGCDSCSHWTHAACAIRNGRIFMGTSVKSGAGGQTEMLFRCRACNGTSKLLGWVKDVFQHSALNWDREGLTRELDFVSRVFRGSGEDPRGRTLFWKCEELIGKLNGGIVDKSIACRAMLMFLQELEVDSPKSLENAELLREAIRAMEMEAQERMRELKKTRMAFEACDRDLKDKVREAAEIKVEMQKKKEQTKEDEIMVRFKVAEADMYQVKANEARREAEELEKIGVGLRVPDKSEEEDYGSSYLKHRLSEAEAEKQYLVQESLRGGGRN